MQLKLPRRPRFLAAHEPPIREQPPRLAEEEDPWAGDDVAWTTDDDLAPEGRGDFLRVFRGVGLWALVGLVFWGLVVFAVFTWLA